MLNLSIKKLKIFNDDKTIVDLTSKIKQTISIGSSLALVGQSGSGKSLSLRTILNLLPSNLESDFLYKSNFDLNFQNIAFIPQNPFTSLSPMTKIGKQFFDINNQLLPKDKIIELLKMVELDELFYSRFPLELSGGQLQRVVIAIALSNTPKLILLDEPTTALDKNTKEMILTLLKKLQDKLGFIFIFISHDIDSVKTICKNIAIMNCGAIVEYGDTKAVLKNPQNDYTKLLIKSNFHNREYRV